MLFIPFDMSVLMCCSQSLDWPSFHLPTRSVLNRVPQIARYWVIAAAAAQLVILSMSSSTNAIRTEAERGCRGGKTMQDQAP